LERTLDLTDVEAVSTPNVREHAAVGLVSLAVLLLRVAALLALGSPIVIVAILCM